MDIVSTEATAWLRAADTAGVELPSEVKEARERLEKVDGELAALPKPTPAPTPEALVASGVPLDKATDESERLAREAELLAETYRVARGAQDQCRRAVNRAVVAHRDELVLGIRPLVTAIIEEARPHASELEPFAPEYAAAALMRRASAKQLKAFQKADELEAKFGVLISAWRASFKAHAKRAGAFDVREVDQSRWYWENPAIVGNDALNGQRRNRYGVTIRIQPTVLGVASEPAEAGFRLATLDELEEIYAVAHRARVEEARYRSLGKRMRVIS